MYRLVATFLLFVLLTVPLQAQAAPNPRAVNLTLKDVGPLWALQSSTTLNNAAAAKQDNETVAQEVQSGRLLAHEVTFQRALTGHEVTILGLILVESGVTQYNNAVHARAAYLRDIKAAPAQAPGHAVPVRVGAVGMKYAAWSIQLPPQNGFKAFGDIILFYRGSYEVFLLGACQELNNTAELLHLAKIVDARIQHATR